MLMRKTLIFLRWLVVYIVGLCVYKHCFHELLDIYGFRLVMQQQWVIPPLFSLVMPRLLVVQASKSRVLTLCHGTPATPNSAL